MDDRMKVMKEIQQRTSTHECPDCGSLTYCAMEDGKSSNLCWCMYVEADPEINPMVADSKCLCKKCLC